MAATAAVAITSPPDNAQEEALAQQATKKIRRKGLKPYGVGGGPLKKSATRHAWCPTSSRVGWTCPLARRCGRSWRSSCGATPCASPKSLPGTRRWGSASTTRPWRPWRPTAAPRGRPCRQPQPNSKRWLATFSGALRSRSVGQGREVARPQPPHRWHRLLHSRRRPAAVAGAADQATINGTRQDLHLRPLRQQLRHHHRHPRRHAGMRPGPAGLGRRP